MGRWDDGRSSWADTECAGPGPIGRELRAGLVFMIFGMLGVMGCIAGLSWTGMGPRGQGGPADPLLLVFIMVLMLANVLWIGVSRR